MTQHPTGIRPKQAAIESLKQQTGQRGAVLFRLGRLAVLMAAVGALSLAAPLYAQRGGGGGGWSGGGSHSSGGGASSGHSSGGASHGASSGARASGGARGSSNGGGRSGSWSGSGNGGNLAHRGGFSAAVRRFFGLSAGSSHGEVPVRNAAFSPEKLPPTLSHIRFAGAGIEFSSRKPLPAITAPPRPIRPHPRQVGYYPPYGFCYECDLRFGFGFGFDLFDFGYTNWYPGFRPQQTASADMILYLNDGSALEAADYWVDGDTLHYVTDDGAERVIAVKDLDLQRTTDANQRLGLKFTLDRSQRGTRFPKAPR